MEEAKKVLNFNGLSKEELIVCKILHYALNNRHGICDPTNFSENDEQIILNFQEKGFLHTDINCIIVNKDFKEFLDNQFGGN